MTSRSALRPFVFAALCATAMPVTTAAPAAAQPAPAATEVPPIDFTERTLGNGLKLIGIRDTTTPNVMVSMWYEVGSKHDPDGRSGFAHLFEHILSRKTVNMPYNAVNRMVDDIGGTRNASTWYDRTNYYEIVPAEYLERMLWTHAERMARPVVDGEVFETERNIVKEELRQRVLAEPYGRLFSFALGENIYSIVPQRRPTIGSIADLDSATLADARAFHQAYYGPDTASLIVSGNFDPAELDALVDRYFGSIPRRARPVPLAIEATDAPLTGSRRVQASGPNVPLPARLFAYRLPGEAHPDMPAIEVLDAILASGDHSRLHSALVEPGLATQAGTYFNNVEEQSFLALNAIVASGQDPAAAETALERAVLKMRAVPPTDAEVEEAKNELLARALAERETFSGRAFELGEALVRTGNPRHADARLAAIATVTPADVRRVAETYLDPKQRIVIDYAKGPGNSEQWANPVPLPQFVTVPPAVGPGNQLLPEGQRQAPPAPGTKPAARAPKIADTRLGNGIRLVAARTGEVPLAAMTLLVRAGSANDPRNLAGRARLAAQIADKGTATRSAEQIAVALERLGASISSSASLDGSYFSVIAPTATLPEAAMILADVVRNASFPQEEFDRERKRALDGLSVAMNSPGALASMLTAPVVYGDAPYGVISGGTPASIAGLDRNSLLEFRRTYWRPELASLVVSGGIDPEAAARIAERAFGDWQSSGPVPALLDDPAGAALPARTVVVDLPGAGQAAVSLVARGLSRADGSYYDAIIANTELGGSSTARLFNEIRSKRALSYGAYSDLGALRDEGMVVASAQTKNESAAEVASVMLAELTKIASQAIEPGVFDSRRVLLTGRQQRALQTSGGFNGTLANALLQGIDPKEVLAYDDRIAAATASGAQAAMARLFAEGKVSLVIVGDSSKFLVDLRKIRPDVTVIPASSLDLARAAQAIR